MSSACAPFVLIGGFVLGAWAQPAHYDSFRDTISALAGRGASDRWIMTLAFVLLGLCHVVTASGLRRSILAVGGLATALLAVAPLPAHGSSVAHEGLAAVALVCLAAWPLTGDRVERWAGAGLLVLVIWFFVALQVASAVGLAERVVTVAQACWPLVAVRRQTALRRAAAPISS